MTRQTRVLKFLTGFAFGGTERQALNIVRSLKRSQFETHIGCLKAVGHLTDEFRSAAASFAEYRIDRLYDFNALKQMIRLAKDLRRRQIDVVHSYGFYGNVFAIPAARLAGVPVTVASIRDMGNVWTPLQTRLQRIACRFADCVLVNADAVKRQLVAEGYPDPKIRVIGNGIAVPPLDASGRNIRKEFGLSPDAPLVAVLAVLRREKGIEYFLEAARILCQSRPDARFLIVGDSVYRPPNGEVVGDARYREELGAYAHSLGIADRVIFTGLRLDAAAILSQIDISVLPTLTEALSNTILESMAAGKPVIATAVGGNPEAVIDGVTGLLVPPRNAAALAGAIAALLADPRASAAMGAAGRQRVIEKFSIPAMAGAVGELYFEFIGKKRARPGIAARLSARPAA